MLPWAGVVLMQSSWIIDEVVVNSGLPLAAKGLYALLTVLAKRERPLTLTELAAEAGCHRETLAGHLAHLRKLELVRVAGTRILG